MVESRKMEQKLGKNFTKMWIFIETRILGVSFSFSFPFFLFLIPFSLYHHQNGNGFIFFFFPCLEESGETISCDLFNQ